MAEYFQQDFALSERRAADLAQVGRSTLRYRSRRAGDNDVRDRMRALATERPRFGYRRLHVLLRREGLKINHKRVYRIYREEGLTVRKKRRKRLSHAPRERLAPPSQPNARWAVKPWKRHQSSWLSIQL